MNKSEIIGNYTNWCREYPGISQPIHFAIFTYLVLHVDSEMSGSVSRGVCMDTLGIFDRITWKRKLEDLHKWGWVSEISIVSSSGRQLRYKVSKKHVENFDNSAKVSKKHVENFDNSVKVSKKHVENFDNHSVENFDSSVKVSKKHVENFDTIQNKSVENFNSLKRQTPDIQDFGENVDNSASCARTHVTTTTAIEENIINNNSKNSSSNNTAREEKIGIGPLKNVYLSGMLLIRAQEICKENFQACVAKVGDWKEGKRDQDGKYPTGSDFKSVTGWALAAIAEERSKKIQEIQKTKKTVNDNDDRDPRRRNPNYYNDPEDIEWHEKRWASGVNFGIGKIPEDYVFVKYPDPRIHGWTVEPSTINPKRNRDLHPLSLD